MKFLRFSVKKYRSLVKECNVGISNLTTIIGPNNEGKSNILRAIVSSVKALEFIAEHRANLRKENDALVARLYRYGDDLFDWYRDYPLSCQRSRKNGVSRSSFVLDFIMDDEELGDLRSITGSVFKNHNVSVSLEFDKNQLLFRMNLKGIFNKRATLQKMVAVADFISSRINICYIDAVRTSETAAESISRLAGMQIRNKLYESETYRESIAAIEKQKGKILDELSGQVGRSLGTFLPSVKLTKIQFDERRHMSWGIRSPLSSISVSIDDGEFTPLSQKGSGVQSLIAIAMAKFVAQQESGSKTCFILAIEEPESHLHPDAIHRVKAILKNIAEQTPVIITTHSPILVNGDDISSNIVVNRHVARPARSKAEIRDILGVHVSDSLHMAPCNLIVEGVSDERIIKELLTRKSKKLKAAFESNQLGIINARGCSKFVPLIKVLRAAICKVHAILDDDDDGREVGERMNANEIATMADITYLRCSGMRNSEIEDIVDPRIYWDKIAIKYGIVGDVDRKLNAINKKWSDRIKSIFESSGKQWGESIESDCKTIVADCVVNCSDLSLCLMSCRSSVVDTLALRIEQLLVLP